MSSIHTVTDETYRDLPSEQTLNEAGSLEVRDEDGNNVSFSSLYDETAPEKSVIIFIRHFFCGACEEYIKAITRSITQDRLTSAKARITIIGCGGHDLIKEYRKRNGVPYTIYADQSLKLYEKLSMPKSSSPVLEGWRAKQPEYHNRSFFNIVFGSAWNMIGSGTKAIRAGPPGQNGGVVIIEKREDGAAVVRFCHRMRTTSDYLQVGELKKVIGVSA